MLHHLACCCLVLLVQQTIQANPEVQDAAEDCREYCTHCDTNNSHLTPNATLRETLEVSLQVAADGMLPYAQIIVRESKPTTSVVVNGETVTLWVNDTATQDALTLATSRSAFWITVKLTRASPDTLLVSTPEDRINVLQAKTTPGSLAVVASTNKTHVAFNCLSGCLIRDSSSTLVGGEAQLRPPFNLYLKPEPQQPPTPSTPSVTPVLTLTLNEGGNKTVNASEWTPDMWYRVKVLVDEGERNAQEGPKEGLDGVMEVQMWVPDGNYSLTRLRGFSWTLHCRPEGATSPRQGPGEGNTKNEAFTSTPAAGGGGDGGGGGGENGEKAKTRSKQKGGREGASAGEVVAWVLVSLALFLVLVLLFAICTKTKRNTHAEHNHDFLPSVGVLSFKDVGGREPEEDSEPESPTLTVPPTPIPTNSPWKPARW